MLVALATVVLTVVFASLAAFAFARYQFRFKEIIFYLFLASLAVPSVDLIIPQYILMARLHLTNSLPGLVLIYSSENLPFSIFLLRGFFEAIPKELEESFRLDGASTLRVLTRLIAPLSIPAIAIVAVFTFNFAWEEFVVALTLINTPAHWTLPIALNFFIGEHTTAVGAAVRRLDDRDGAERHRLPDLAALVPARRLARRHPVTAVLADLRCQYLTGEEIVASGLPAQVASARLCAPPSVARSPAMCTAGEARFHRHTGRDARGRAVCGRRRAAR